MKRDIQLFVIDPQNDFCDIPSEDCPTAPHQAVSPALPVPGAHADMQRLGLCVERGLSGLSAITVTLDSHHHVGIERPGFWLDYRGEAVAPFTEISAAEVRQGAFAPAEPRYREQALAYLEQLETRGRYKLMVWTRHCEIGTWGHNVHADLRGAYNAWEERTLKTVHKVTKGSNPWTEHYSAFAAEVPRDDDPQTQLNRALIDRLSRADLLFVAGEAGSHCVKASVEDLVANVTEAQRARIVLLADCISPVAGFEGAYESFLSEMKQHGVQTATSLDLAHELLANA